MIPGVGIPMFMGASGLYQFTTFTFTNCGVTGKNGPSLAQMQSAYSATAWTQNTLFFNIGPYNGIQKWTVPATGTYRIEVVGAAGGTAGLLANYGATLVPGGNGARVITDVNLIEGQYLTLLVGQKGGDNNVYYRGGGGGGGSYVYNYSTSTLLAVAGGGGGAGNYATDSNINGTASTSGQYGATGSTANAGGAGGTGGSGGSGYMYAGGGAGWNSSGTTGTYGYGGGGTRFLDGGVGGALYSDGRDGGFGGGGGCYAGAGGAGGYSGGGGGGWSYAGYGGGAGSYYTGTLQSWTAGYNSGHGYITITKL